MLTWTIGLIAACACGYLWSSYAHNYYLTRQDFSKRSKLHHDLSLFSECGFYYSFFEQVAGANDTAHAMDLMLNDRLSEYPDTINAMSRFNIYPEVIVGFLYRTVKSTPWLAALLADTAALSAPSAFYYFCVFAWSGLSVASIFVTGFLLSGRTLAGGLIAALVFVVNFKFSSQVHWSPTLRECWALPLGHALMALLVHWFSLADADVRPRHYAAIFVVLLLALVPWQFTPFMLLAQVLSIYSVSVLGFISLARVAALFRVYAAAYVLAAILMFGQLTFLHSFSFCFVVGVLLLEFVLRKSSSVTARVRALRPSVRWLADAVVVRGVGAVVAFLCVFFVAKVAFDTHANSHVSTFMSIKLHGLLPRLSELASGQDKFSGGAPPSFAHIHDFDTLMYVCQTEFDFMPVWAALRILRMSLFVQLSVASVALVALNVVVFAVRQWRSAGKRAAADESEAAHFAIDTELDTAQRRRAAELFMVAQSFSFLIYAVMVERFAVLSTPAFSALCGVLASPELPFAVIALVRRSLRLTVPSLRTVVDARIAHQLLAVLVVLGVAVFNRDLLRSLTAPAALPLQHDTNHQVELMRYIFRNTPANASFSASMPLVSSIRLITGRAVTMHPQYESADTRARIRKVYQMYGLMPLADVHRLLRDDVKTDYFVLEMDYCNGQLTNNCFVVDMVDEYQHYKRWTADQIACKRALALPQSNAMFERVFSNSKFVVFKVK